MPCFGVLRIDGDFFPITCLTCREAFTVNDLHSMFDPLRLGQIKSVAQGRFKMRPGNNELDFCDKVGCNMFVKLPPLGLSEAELKTVGGYVCHCEECQIDYCRKCTQDKNKIFPPHKGETCEQAQAADEPDVAFHRQKIEELLCIRCPRCNQVFEDFRGCCSLYCGCGCSFCAICFRDCGSNAHDCAARCLVRIGKAKNTYFIEVVDYPVYLLTKHAQDISEYLQTIVSRSLREQVFIAIKPFLKGRDGGDIKIDICP